MIQLKTQFLVQSRVDGLQHKFHYKFGDDKIYMVHKMDHEPACGYTTETQGPGHRCEF